MLPRQVLCAPARALVTGLTGPKNARAEDACYTVVSTVREIDGSAHGARRSTRRDNRSMFSWSTARICGFYPSGWR
jgi:hypothetical protein